MWGLSTSDLQAIKEVIISILPPKFFKSFCFRICEKRITHKMTKVKVLAGVLVGES